MVWSMPERESGKMSKKNGMGLVRRLCGSALAVLSLAGALSSPAAKAATMTPTGVWLWDTGDAAVEFHACGEALCGRIVWLKRAGQLDDKNPDPALHGRPVCGIDYIMGLRRTKNGDWENGRVYDFNGGASYDLDIDLVQPDRVDMRGYEGIRLLGQTLHLVPAPADLTRCAVASAQ
jgi:uncharacterized protein (DUF2147 family)